MSKFFAFLFSVAFILYILVSYFFLDRIPEERRAEIAEMQKLYNEQNFEGMYYRWDEEYRHQYSGHSSVSYSDDDYKAFFVQKIKKDFERLGKIKEAKLKDTYF